MPNRPRLSYANTVSTLALFLALSGGVAYAASTIKSGDIAPGAVRTSDVFKRAITSGKLAVGAVRSNQIADAAVRSSEIAPGAVGSSQIAPGAVGTKQLAPGAVAPSNMQFPVFYAASPTGGSMPVTDGPDPYPLTNDTWTQNPGQIEVVFGAGVATLAYDESGGGACRVYFDVRLNGQQVGGGEVSTSSTTLTRVEQSIGAQPQIDPLTSTPMQLSVRTGSNGECTPESTIDSTRFRVLDFG